MTAETSLLRETGSGAVYRVAIRGAERSGRGKAADPTPCSLEFRVTPEGALGFDNRQPEARLVQGRALSLLLAAEMARTARERVPGALSGRSTKGLARELRLHRRAWALGFLRRQAVIAEMGSPDPAAPDYDHNAALFEHPLRGLPSVLKALRRK